MSTIKERIAALPRWRREADLTALRKLRESYRTEHHAEICPLCKACKNEAGNRDYCRVVNCVWIVITKERCCDFAESFGLEAYNIRYTINTIKIRKRQIPRWIRYYEQVEEELKQERSKEWDGKKR